MAAGGEGGGGRGRGEGEGGEGGHVALNIEHSQHIYIISIVRVL